MAALIWAVVALLVALAAGLFLWIRGGSTRKPVVQAQRHQQDQASYKYELAREIALPDPGSSSESVIELPRKYGQDRLVLLARDPYWLYAYWEISVTRQEDFSKQFGPVAWPTSQPVLRIYDVTGIKEFIGGNAHSCVDLPLDAEAESWHIEVGQANRAYCVDLGRVLPNGEFVPLLRSNVTATPRDALSERLDEEWLWIEDVYRSLTKLHTELHAGTSSPLLIEEMRERMGKE